MGRPRKNDKETQESVEDTRPGEPEAEATLQAEAETAAEAAPAAEQETAAEEPAAEPEPAPRAESAAEAEEVIAEAAVTDELETDEPVGTAAPAPEAPAEAPKKKKRFPRAQRRQRPKTKRGSGGERKPIVRLPRPERERGPRKERRGVVVSSAMDKTIVVRVETVKPHPVYKKVVRRSRKFQVHDEGNVAKPGDVVRIVETRPLSKTKTWRLAEVLEAAK